MILKSIIPRVAEHTEFFKNFQRTVDNQPKSSLTDHFFKKPAVTKSDVCIELSEKDSISEIFVSRHIYLEGKRKNKRLID